MHRQSRPHSHRSGHARIIARQEAETLFRRKTPEQPSQQPATPEQLFVSVVKKPRILQVLPPEQGPKTPPDRSRKATASQPLQPQEVINDKELEDIRRWYRNGMTIREIARDVYDIPPATLRRLLRDRGMLGLK